MNRAVLKASLVAGVSLAAVLSLRANTQSNAARTHRLRLDVTGVSGIYPAAAGQEAKRTVVFPDATMPSLARRVCPGDPDYIIPAHYAYVRVPMRSVVLKDSRPPTFIIESSSLKYVGDGEILLARENDVPTPAAASKTFRIGIWLIGLDHPEKLTLPDLPVASKNGNLANTAVFGDICWNPDIEQRYLSEVKGHVASIFELPKAYLATGHVTNGVVWILDPPREDGAASKPGPLAQSVYSEWYVRGTVTLSTVPLGPGTKAGVTPGPGPIPTPLIVLTAARGDIFVRTGDAPLDDLLEVSKKEIMNVDTHFELYYLLTSVRWPSLFPTPGTFIAGDHLGTIHVPRLDGGPKTFYYPHGHNCPPAVFKDAAGPAALSEQEARRFLAVAATPTPCPTPPYMSH